MDAQRLVSSRLVWCCLRRLQLGALGPSVAGTCRWVPLSLTCLKVSHRRHLTERSGMEWTSKRRYRTDGLFLCISGVVLHDGNTNSGIAALGRHAVVVSEVQSPNRRDGVFLFTRRVNARRTNVMSAATNPHTASGQSCCRRGPQCHVSAYESLNTCGEHGTLH